VGRDISILLEEKAKISAERVVVVVVAVKAVKQIFKP